MQVALDGVADSVCWSLSDNQVEGLLEDAHRLEGRLHELTLRMVAEAERRRAGSGRVRRRRGRGYGIACS
jgi:hypothetical protein